MARTRKGTFKCGRCKRTFSMAAHLARHQAAMHGVKKAGKRKYTKRTRRSFRRSVAPQASWRALG
jgi:uncharacterized C2H2 Zn-finger protein